MLRPAFAVAAATATRVADTLAWHHYGRRNETVESQPTRVKHDDDLPPECVLVFGQWIGLTGGIDGGMAFNAASASSASTSKLFRAVSA